MNSLEQKQLVVNFATIQAAIDTLYDLLIEKEIFSQEEVNIKIKENMKKVGFSIQEKDSSLIKVQKPSLIK